MKLVVKNLEVFTGHDGVGIHCNIYYKGKQLGYAHDDAHGGELDFRIHPSTDENKLRYVELQTFAKSQPKYDINALAGIKDRGEKWINVTVEDVLNEVINKAIEKKEMGKFNRDAKKGILYGKNVNTYHKYWWTGYNLQKLVSGIKGRTLVQNKVNDLKAKGETIMNAEYLKSLGIKI